MAQFIKPKSLSVVVPVRNEEENVADLIFEIRQSLKNKINFEWSANLAYVVGLITSDGSLSKDGFC